MALLSVIVPFLNEASTLPKVIARVRNSGHVAEIVAVDDGSTDGSGAVLSALASAPGVPVRLLGHERNRGKGAAIRTGLAAVTGQLVLIQDADLEYNPAEYARLLAPFADPAVQVVYGSRNLQPNPRSNA
ncbi:MAG: glycosyltransferase family 2 protein, partial [Opitutaceae bacterium]